MVSSLEETYLSSAGLSTLRTHFIASLKNFWYDNYLFRVLPSTFAKQFHHNSSPKSPLCDYSFQKRSKVFKSSISKFLPRRTWCNLIKNDERKRRREYPWSLAKEFKWGVQIKWPNIYSSVSPFPPFPLNIWNSMRSELIKYLPLTNYSSARQYM